MGDKQKTMKRMRIIVGFIFAIGLVGLVALPSNAAENANGTGSVVGYSADRPLDDGTIVVLQDSKNSKVKAATQSQVQNMFGVTVDPNQLTLRISNGEMQNEVFVAVSGTYDVLVSNQEGDIAAGDYLTLSSIDGVAMKAGDQEVTVFGRANAGFIPSSVSLGTASLKDTDGKTKTVRLGSIPVTIDIKNNPNHKSTEAKLPDFLRRVGKAVAEKEVSPLRMYLSIGIAVISLIAAIAVLYAGVRNSVISIGRNPMSKGSIFRALLEVILTSALILIIGLFAVYLLLKL